MNQASNQRRSSQVGENRERYVRNPDRRTKGIRLFHPKPDTLTSFIRKPHLCLDFDRSSDLLRNPDFRWQLDTLIAI